MGKNVSPVNCEEMQDARNFHLPRQAIITYSMYKKLWEISGPVILDAWKFSCEKGVMPPSHKESIITLLPKEGKNVKDIKNWRPITLSNCDSKIITKALALRMAKVLDEVIDHSQTAYVGGRAVADNLRSIMFMKDHCREKNQRCLSVTRCEESF